MKNRFLLLVFCVVPFLFGPTACRPQNPVTPPQSTCPPAGAYVAINATATTATTFTVSAVSAPTCFMAQGSLPSSGTVIAQNGNPTNIAGPTQGGATGKVQLSVTPTPTAGQTAAGEQWTYFSALAVTALAPANATMGSPTTSELVRPTLPGSTTVPAGILTVAKLEK